MVNISNNGIISMNRGDTVEVPLFINVNDKLLPVRYPFSNADEIYLGITEPNQKWEHGKIPLFFCFIMRGGAAHPVGVGVSRNRAVLRRLRK